MHAHGRATQHARELRPLDDPTADELAASKPAVGASSTPQAQPFHAARTGSTLGSRQEPVMTHPQLFSIIGSVLGVGLALAVLIMRSTARIDADRRAFQTEAAADRRAFQAGMDQVRTEMQRLAERQSNLEGAHTAPGD